MLALPELQLNKVLSEGFSAISRNIDVLDDIFAAYPPELLDEVKKYLRGRNIPVVLNWPREGATSPVVAITNAGDQESVSQDTLGDHLETVYGDAVTSREYRGLALNSTYQVYVLTDDPRAAMYLGYIVLTLFIINAQFLQAQGLHNVTLSVSDLRFEEALLPEWSNSRMVTVNCLHYHAVPFTQRMASELCVNVQLEVQEE